MYIDDLLVLLLVLFVVIVVDVCVEVDFVDVFVVFDDDLIGI